MPETVVDNRLKHAVGAYLREIRESRGITLDDAAAVTRIGKNYLLAIEEGTFDKLPSPAYVKGFIRVYSGYLGLSSDEVIARLETAGASPKAMVHEEAPRAGAPRGRKAKHSNGFRSRWLVSLLLLALVIVVANLFGEKAQRPKPPASPVSASVPPIVAPVAVIQPALSSAVASAPPPLAAAASKAETLPVNSESSSRGIVLRLKVNQDSSLNITIDDFSQQYDLKAGDLIEWKADRQFTLDLGNAGGVEAEFNGRALQPLGAKGQPAHIVLKADGKQE